MGGDGEEKTEPATPKKRNEQRKKGNVMMSKDVVTVVTLFAGVVMIRLGFAGAVDSLSNFLLYCFRLIRGDVTPEITNNMYYQCVGLVLRVCAPLIGVVILAATVATMYQTKMLVTFEALKPDFKKLNPLSGLKRLFSLKSLLMTFMNLIKIILLLVIVFLSVRDFIQIAERYMYAEIPSAITHLMQSIFSMLMRIGLAFLVLSAIDYLYQRWSFEKNMRMTKQEVKEEFKQTEGDPKVKGKIRQIQREMAMSRMMQKVPGADVIVRNPTHVAVALRYRAGEDEAPVVLAMGLDYLAQRIISVAEANDVLVIENVALARAIYAEGELDRPIPPDLYEPVAEIMVYLYKLGRIQA